MNMNEARYKPFRLHLSTVMGMTILAGVAIGVNFVHHTIFEETRSKPHFVIWSIGWPCPYSTGLSVDQSEENQVKEAIRERIKAHDAVVWAATDNVSIIDQNYVYSLLYDIAIGFGVVIIAAVGCELWIWKRQKHNSPSLP